MKARKIMKITTMAELLKEEAVTIKRIDGAINTNKLDYAAELLTNFVSVNVYGVMTEPGQNTLNFSKNPTLEQVKNIREKALNVILNHFKKIDWSEY